jgi:uncharacterized protein (TIGR02453 family)
MIEESTFIFLRNLEENNNREWFLNNKVSYEYAKNNFTDFCEQLLNLLKEIQPNLLNTEIKNCIFRINRDVRFSKNKNPYKNHLSAAFGPGGRNSGKIDFYFHLQNNETFLGGGMWQPSPENLNKFRQEIDYNPGTLKSIIYSSDFKANFPHVYGEKLKTSPKNYNSDHPEIDLLRYKELFFMAKYTNEEVLSEGFLNKLLKDCEILKPYIDYLNDLFYDNE